MPEPSSPSRCCSRSRRSSTCGRTARQRAKKTRSLELNNLTLEGTTAARSPNGARSPRTTTRSPVRLPPRTTITPVVRKEGSGTTHVFKRYLGLISNGVHDRKRETKTWNRSPRVRKHHVAESRDVAGLQRPAVAHWSPRLPKRRAASATPLADARADGSFAPASGGAGTAKFWARYRTTVPARQTEVRRPVQRRRRHGVLLRTASPRNTPTAKSLSRGQRSRHLERGDHRTPRRVSRSPGSRLRPGVHDLATTADDPGSGHDEFHDYLCRRKTPKARRPEADKEDHDYLALPRAHAERGPERHGKNRRLGTRQGPRLRPRPAAGR